MKRTKLIALLVALTLVIGLLPVTAVASDLTFTLSDPAVWPIADENISYSSNMIKYTHPYRSDLASPSSDQVGWFKVGDENCVDNNDPDAIYQYREMEDIPFSGEHDYVLVFAASASPVSFPDDFSADDIKCSGFTPYKVAVADSTVNYIKFFKLYFHCVTNYPGNYEVIDFLSTGALAPEVYEGETPSTSVVINDSITPSKNFKVSDVDWHVAGKPTEKVTTFSMDTNYEVSFRLACTEYSSFVSTDIDDIRTCIPDICGESGATDVEWSTVGSSLKISFRPKTAKLIKVVNLTGIQTPVIGGNPQATGFTAAKSYIKPEFVEWRDSNNKAFAGKFEAEKTYTLYLKLKCDEGYTFANTLSKDSIDANAGEVYSFNDMWGGVEAYVVGIRFTLPKSDKIPVESISLSSASESMTITAQNKTPSIQLTASILPKTATDKSVTWASSDTKVATVDSTGKVTAAGEGSCKIICQANDGSGVSDSCDIAVYAQKVTSIALNATEGKLNITASDPAPTLQLQATVNPNSAVNQGVTWSSDKTAVATVDNNGKVTAAGAGTCVITCTAKDGSSVSASCSITVTKAADPVPETCTVSFDANGGSGTMAAVTVNKGAKYKLPACGFTAPAGKEFDKWDLGAPGTEITVSANVTVKAQWKDPAPIDISGAKFSKIKNQTYTGKKITPSVTLKLGDKTLVKGTDYTLSWKSNKAIGTATVTAKGKGLYTGTAKATFKIIPKKVTLSSVKAGSKMLTIKWKKGSSITGYEIQYSMKSNFKGAKKMTIKKAATTSTVIKKLTKGKTYYVRIRAYKTVKGKKYYSAWSTKKKAKVK